MDKMASTLDGICYEVTKMEPETHKHKADTNKPFQESTDNRPTEKIFPLLRQNKSISMWAADAL